MRSTVLILAALPLCGCAARADHVFVAPGRLVTGSSGAQPGYAVKLVGEKRAPGEVVGDDGSVCRLTAERFAAVQPGDWLACEWTVSPDPTASLPGGRARGMV